MLTTERNRIVEVRRAFPSLDEMTYLNVATHGLTPQPILDRYLELISLTARYGHMRYDDQDVPAYQRARSAVAGILDVPPTWVAFGRNATDGINQVLAGLAWQPGDEVIISDQEHPAVYLPWNYGARRGFFTPKTFTVDPDPAVTLRNLEEQITPRTRLIACSHVSSQTGIRLPGPAICALAQRLNDAGRDRPILTLIDGTQELGQWRVSVPAIGCDFYVSNGHKWLGGPKGSGILVVREQAFPLLTPPYMAGGIDDFEDHVEDVLNHRDAPRMFESGTQNLAVVTVLADLVNWLDNLGWSWIEERESNLAAYIRAQLRTVPGVTLLTPDAWEQSSAITSFTMEGMDALHIHRTLWDQRIIARWVPERNGIRIATPYFTIEEELDRLISALRRIRAA
ncbi:MAG: Cysteine desulfurase [Chloroflexi bacterium]|nr:Cysteine desulfurase [Chloroflexota bacterium]